MQIQNLTNLKDWELMWDEQQSEDSGALLVVKLSPTCPISHAAESEFRSFADALPDSKDLKIVTVDVIAQRPISQRIAADTGIQHASPQALLISRRNVRWNASHGGITQASLAMALSSAHA